MKFYHLPDFHLTANIWMQNPRGTLTGIRTPNVSCQLVGHSWEALTILKLPKGTKVLTEDTISSSFVGDAVQIMDKPTMYWEVIEYTRVAAGYPNEYDSYAVRLLSPPGPNPHD